ncbi:MAG: hypothetical protein ABI822_25040, partial [Bryobacteraceae bacterium]
VRRVNKRDLAGNLGTRLSSPRQAIVKISIHGYFRVLTCSNFDGTKRRLRVFRTAMVEPELSVEAAAPLPRPFDTDPVLKTVLHQTSVRDAIYHQAAKVLKSKYLGFCKEVFAKFSRQEPLLDVIYPNTVEGVAAWYRGLEGDFTTALHQSSGIETLRADLSDALPYDTEVELYLPKIEKKDWKSPAAALERSPVRSNEAAGQIFVGWPEQHVTEGMLRLAGFACANSTTGTLHHATVAHSGTPCEASAGGRSIPLAFLTSWFEAPGDRECTYTPAYGDISLAVQQFLRQELPRRWFSKRERYARIADSHAMLVYQCSRPFVGRTRTELTYEFQNPDSMKRFYKTANLALPSELDRIQEILSGSAHAGRYQRIFSRDIVAAVAARRRNLDRLMSAESSIIECFIEFGRAGHEFRRRMLSHPEETAEGIVRYASDFAKALTCRTKRIHPSLDCGDLVLPLLMKASTALNRTVRGPSLDGYLWVA